MFCLTVAEKSYKEVFKKIEIGAKYTDFFELRVDYLEKPDKSQIREFLKLPYKFLFTFRSKKEGGIKRVSATLQLEWILWALEEDFYLVDVEWHLFKKFYQKFNPSYLNYDKILISYHNFEKVPSDAYLLKVLKDMKKKKIKKAKIVCMCKSFHDSLRLLNFINVAKKMGIELISFGMGKEGKLSRILCLFSGSPFTYVVLSREEAVAPGQLDIQSAMEIYNFIKQMILEE